MVVLGRPGEIAHEKRKASESIALAGLDDPFGKPRYWDLAALDDGLGEARWAQNPEMIVMSNLHDGFLANADDAFGEP